jgi:hypothetical protein
MIVFRNIDSRYPFLWESSAQPPGRWHAAGTGPVHYFADTSDGAWAEFIRHAELTPEELPNVQRTIWAVEVGDIGRKKVDQDLPYKTLTGGKRTYPRCQNLARHLRDAGIRCFSAPSAALIKGGARGWRVQDGLQPGPPRDGRTIVFLQRVPNAIGWLVGYCPPPHYLKNLYVPMRALKSRRSSILAEAKSK